MKKFLFALCACCLCFLAVLALSVTTTHAKSDKGKDKEKTVCICHHPPGNPDNSHTICIGESAARAHMKHGDTLGACPVTCDGDDDCSANQFCKRAAGVCAGGAIGVCTNRPSSCPLTIVPVCGCDGTTYDNACLADAAGVTVSQTGACVVACTGNGDCGTNQFCKRDEGICAADASGTCADRPAACPSTIVPVCGCDGTTYDNACLADAAGVTVSHTGACEVAGACGGASGTTCGEGQFCKRDDGACAADASGVCTAIPLDCPPEETPVCGCDGETYSNRCFAEGVGVTVASEGACPTGTACGGTGGTTCAEGSFCKPTDGDCAANAPGTCTPVPAVCSKVFDPVCGCDGKTYDNDCTAHMASVGISHAGECAADQVACGGTGGTACGEGEFCSRPEGECAADTAGVCEPSPGSCPDVLEPVCGCDGKTHSSKCIADALGVTVDHDGACVQSLACGGDTEQKTCPSALFCKGAVGACGANAPGTCAFKPESCPVTVAVVCGCDGVTYDNACLAAAVGVTVNHEGACTTAR